MGNSLLEVVWAQNLVLCERIPWWAPRARLSAGRGAAAPAPAPAPAPRPLDGKNSSAAGVSARPRIWLPRAGIERLQPPSLPPDGVCWRTHGSHGCARRSCPRRPLASTSVPEAPASPALESRLHQSPRDTKNPLLQPERLLGAFWASRGKVNARLSAQSVFCSALAQVWLSRCSETVL